MLLLLIVLFLSTPLSAVAQRGHEADSSFHAMQRRGRIAMGVDQYVSTHRFEPLSDGGRIELQSDAGDSASVAAIRAHFHRLVQAFRAGDFSTPAFVHFDDVPGTRVMAERRRAIRYEMLELARGGGLRLTSSDPQAVAAIHEFLEYQRREHRASGHAGAGHRHRP